MINQLYIGIALLSLGVLLILVIVLLLKIRDSILISVPFIATKEKAFSVIIEKLQLKDGSILYDLGCGDGYILKKAIEKNSECVRCRHRKRHYPISPRANQYS